MMIMDGLATFGILVGVFLLLTEPSCAQAPAVPVAFSAALTTDMGSVTTDIPITFDQIDTNVGDAFDGTVFRVPSAGLYLFTFAGKSNHMAIHLKVNGEVKMSAIITKTGEGIYGTQSMSSNSVILILSPFDQVSLFLSEWGTAGLINSSPEPGIYTSFTGALLFDSLQPDVDGFSAALTTNTPSVSVNTPITFDLIHTELNGAFDGTSFDADSTGVYLFTFSCKGTYTKVQLEAGGLVRRNTATVPTGYVDNLSSNYALMAFGGSSSDDVLLYQMTPYDGLVNTSPSNGIFTSFSGIELFQMDNTNISASSGIAFSAARTLYHGCYSNLPTLLEFDFVETNIGLAFDGLTTFVAPVQGYYMFMFSTKGSGSTLHLKVNGVTRRSVICDVGNSICMASNSIILLLNVSDRVNIEIPGYSEGIDETSAGVQTSFSGFLLHEVTT